MTKKHEKKIENKLAKVANSQMKDKENELMKLSDETSVISLEPMSIQSIISEQLVTKKICFVELTADEEKILYQDFADEDVQIRPDGIIYLEAGWYRQRLHEAFKLGFQLIEEGNPQRIPRPDGSTTLIRHFHLFIKGVYVASAYGEHTDTRSNQMSYGDCLESAKSNALTRLCKEIGMANRLWRRDFIEQWKQKYAEAYKDRDGRVKWRKKGIPQTKQSPQVATPDEQTEEESQFISQQQRKFIFAKLAELSIPAELFKEWLEENYNVTSTTLITTEMMDGIMEMLNEVMKSNKINQTLSKEKLLKKKTILMKDKTPLDKMRVIDIDKRLETNQSQETNNDNLYEDRGGEDDDK